jgi:hypothetical protein
MPTTPTLRTRLQEAACDYAHLAGWQIVPGSTWTGAEYTRGHTNRIAGEFEPVFPRPTRDVRRLHSLWKIAPYSVLTPTGRAFDVISVPLVLGVAATRTAPFRRSIAPASLSPDRIRFLVRPGLPLAPDLPGVELCAAGECVPLPPSPVRGGALTWWISPVATDWLPGDPLAVQAALREAAADLRQPCSR